MSIETFEMGKGKRFCKRCGHMWVSRGVAVPIACPGCQSHAWDHDTVYRREKVLCVRCGFSWLPHNPAHRPIACPGCKSRTWDGLHDRSGRLLPGAVLPDVELVELPTIERVELVSAIPDGAAVAPYGPSCIKCYDVGCAACKPVYDCSHCSDRGMVAARGGCPKCGRVYA